MRIRTAFFAGVLFALPFMASAQNPSYLKWREYESDHFIVYYSEGQELTAFQAIEIAEKVHEPLVNMYGPLDSRVVIVIKDTEDYANGGAYFFDNKIEISATELDYEFRSYSDWLWNVVTHELTHIYSMRQSMKAPRWLPMAYYQHIDYKEEKREDVLIGYPNVLASYPIAMFNVPSWFAEGVAQYQARNAQFDRWDTHRDMILRQAVLNDNLLTIDQMAIFNWTGLENEMVYNHGFGFVRYIAEKFGEEKISELMKAMSSASTVTFNTACRTVLAVSQDELYDLWVSSMKKNYNEVRDSLGELKEGSAFRKGGYINGFPTWSPDGSKIAYVSNRGQDYSITYCRVANLSPGGWQWKGKKKQELKMTKKLEINIEKLDDPEEIEDARLIAEGNFDISLAAGIQSGPIWLDEWNILYNRRMPSDRYGSHWWDMYRYVINTNNPQKGKRTRITNSLRGTYPHLSPDKSKLVFVKNKAGLNNLFIMDRNDNSLKQLTYFDDGSRIYHPRWSPDGKRIVFTIHQKSHVGIAMINKNGTDFKYVINSQGQDRDPVWTRDGNSIVFSSDIIGIPNLYRMKLDNDSVYQLTNVIGGAFSPTLSPKDTTLAFSYYGKDGYEIRLMPMSGGIPVDNARLFKIDVDDKPDDQNFTEKIEQSTPYIMKTLDFSFMPVVRNDRGNVKLSSYVLKNEVIDRGSFLFSGSISPTNRDTDLYGQFLYKKFIPDVFIEMYRLTRSVDKNENFMEEYGTIIRKRIYDLNEIDFGLRYVHRDRHEFESRLIYSQYNAKVEYTHFLTGTKIHKPYYTYSRGFDLAFIYRHDRFIRARDEVINPRGGRKIDIRYDRFINFFLDDFEYVGFLREKYKKHPYNRYYINWVERLPVPGTRKHTLLLRGKINIIDRQVDDFYEEQLGGPNQMSGYTFYSLSGRKNVMAQALYRFPVFFDMQKSFAIWYFNHVYGGVFADIGKAWNKHSLNWSTKGFKRDIGFQLRMDALSFYIFPTMLEFTAAYGPDDTWIKHFDEEKSKIYLRKDTQDPWKFYFTVLFGFNQ
ncbi:hypothetical protein ACFL1R_09765 [Candidatus Latescibacterota bacterium]